VNARQDTSTRHDPASRGLGRGHHVADHGRIGWRELARGRVSLWGSRLTWAALWVTVLLALGLSLFTELGGHPGLLWGARGCGSGVRLVADTVVAQGQPGGGGSDPTQQFMGIVDRARQWLMWVLTAVVGLIIVFAGLRYAFAGGRIEEIEAAKRTLKAAVTGYLLAVLADSLVAVLRMVAGS
jgi:hypothetical protein